MPEKNTKIVSKYEGEKGYSYEKKLIKLCRKIGKKKMKKSGPALCHISY